MVDAFNTGDLSALDSVVSPYYVDHQGIDGSEMFGQDGFASVVKFARGSHPGLRVTIQELEASGDTVNAHLTWFETEPAQRPGLLEPAPTQRRTMETVRFADGLAIEHWGRASGLNSCHAGSVYQPLPDNY